MDVLQELCVGMPGGGQLHSQGMAPSAVGMALQRGKDASDSPALDVHGKAPVKAPRLGGLQSNSRPEDILDLTDMADIVQRYSTDQLPRSSRPGLFTE